MCGIEASRSQACVKRVNIGPQGNGVMSQSSAGILTRQRKIRVWRAIWRRTSLAAGRESLLSGVDDVVPRAADVTRSVAGINDKPRPGSERRIVHIAVIGGDKHGIEPVQRVSGE